MKFRIKIDDHHYEVEIGSVRERPIIARVNGTVVEVWPEGHQRNHTTTSIKNKSSELKSSSTTVSSVLKDTSINNKEAHSIQPSKDVDDIKIGGRVNIVRAPIPGLITALLVQPGYEVSAGQELCKLEAMKMNNSIRSTRTGKIAKIYVSVGQQVQHNEVLMEYAG